MRGAGCAGLALLEAPDQGAGAAEKETRAQAPLLQHAQLPAAGGRESGCQKPRPQEPASQSPGPRPQRRSLRDSSALPGKACESARSEAPRLPVFLGHDQGRRVRPGINQRQAALHAQQADGSVQAVGGSGVGSNHGGLNALRHAQAGRRIHDVRIADAVDLDELLGVAGGRDAGIVKQEVLGGFVRAALKRRDPDLPTALAGRRAPDGDVAAGRDERAVESPAPSGCCRAWSAA